MQDVFPQFIRDSHAHTLPELFSVSDRINVIPVAKKVVVSTSLYWGTHAPHLWLHRPASLKALQEPHLSGRHSVSWWGNYFLPFLDGCRQILPEGWVHRVYLARDLSFLIDFIPLDVEIFLMEYASWESMPGMLWRYLPVEEDVLCVARGADNYALGDYQNIVRVALDLGVFLVRTTTSDWRDVLNRLIYRSIHGSCCIRGPLEFKASAQAWIIMNRDVAMAQEVKAFPELTHVGLSHWGAYGQDEQFLCRWLYYLAARRRTLTLLHPDGNHELFKRDICYWNEEGRYHSIIFR